MFSGIFDMSTLSHVCFYITITVIARGLLSHYAGSKESYMLGIIVLYSLCFFQECAQFFIPGSTFSWCDVVVNLSSVTLGLQIEV